MEKTDNSSGKENLSSAEIYERNNLIFLKMQFPGNRNILLNLLQLSFSGLNNTAVEWDYLEFYIL